MTRESHDFLELSCGNTGFLMNRNQFNFSRMVEGERPVKTRIPWIDGLMEHQGENLLSLNLEGYLRDLFGEEPCTGAGIALIAPTELFLESHQTMYKKLTSSAKIPLSHQKVVFKVGNKSIISPVPLREIKLIPSPMRRKLAQTGFLGVRWKSDSTFQYFIDMETILFHLILSCARKAP